MRRMTSAYVLHYWSMTWEKVTRLYISQSLSTSYHTKIHLNLTIKRPEQSCSIIRYPEPIFTSAHARGEMTGCRAGCQEVDRCSTRGGSQGLYTTFASTKAYKADPSLALKPRGDITRNPKQRYQGTQNKTHVCVHQKLFLKK